VTQRSCVLQPVAEEAVGSVSQVRINASKCTDFLINSLAEKVLEFF
jgi:hypothetical protein